MEEIQAAAFIDLPLILEKYYTGTIVIGVAECAYSFILVIFLVFLSKRLITFSRR